MYEQQTPFELSDFIGLTYFLNNLLYKAIQGNLLGKKSATTLEYCTVKMSSNIFFDLKI